MALSMVCVIVEQDIHGTCACGLGYGIYCVKKTHLKKKKGYIIYYAFSILIFEFKNNKNR